MYALRGGGDVGLQICERADLRSDEGADGLRVFGVDRLVGPCVSQRGFVVRRGGFWGFLERIVS